jgi:hypothetical protein
MVYLATYKVSLSVCSSASPASRSALSAWRLASQGLRSTLLASA